MTGRSPAPWSNVAIRRWRSWDARRSEPGPWHTRRNHPDGSKTVTWPTGLGDHHLEDLVYLTPLAVATLPLMPLDPLLYLVIAEGEKAADAVAGAGIPAVGTVCGAASTPGPAVVEFLSRGPVVLAPDNDEVGRGHMNRLGRALERSGVRWLAVVRPPADAPPGWDLADVPRETIHELVDDAALRPIGPVAA